MPLATDPVDASLGSLALEVPQLCCAKQTVLAVASAIPSLPARASAVRPGYARPEMLLQLLLARHVQFHESS
jgi:hypothetical protein